MKYIALLAVLVVAVAASNCNDHPWPYKRNTLSLGETLNKAEVLETKTAKMSFDAEGKLNLVRKQDNATLWSTGTAGGEKLVFESNGDLVVKGQDDKIVWKANQFVNNGRFLALQDDCNFVMYEHAPQTNETWSTGTQMCVTAHIVMHSHDDPGWLLTPERYYDGCYDPNGGVQSIITTVVEALAANSSRTFVQVEMYYFHRWWVRQEKAVQDLARKLVENGQLDFINAGWSMHDEGCVHQESAISNMEAGAQFLRREFGNRFNLSIGWHIDPFGHASSTPRLMSQMAFDAFFFWRTDYQHREHMIQTKTLETMWNSSPSLKDSVLMFTSILYDSYCMGCQSSAYSGLDMCPDGFCCMDCEVMDESGIPNWDVHFRRLHEKDRKRQMSDLNELRKQYKITGDGPLTISYIAEAYVSWIKNYATAFRTGHVLVPWGCDFQHIDAPQSFMLMDQVLAEINGNYAKYGLFLEYSTPDRYVKTVAEMDYSWPVNDYDYFIESDDGWSYWSGYFSSRAEFKGFERFLMNERTSMDAAFSSIPRHAINRTEHFPHMNKLREAMGVAQHHDAITGTERVHVRNRYQDMMTEGWTDANEVFTAAIESTTGVKTQWCPLSNLSSCPATDVLGKSNAVMSLYVYNQLGWTRTEMLTIPVPTNEITSAIAHFQNGTTAQLHGQIQPVWLLTTSEDPTSPDHKQQPFELLLSVTLPPFSLTEVVLSTAAAASSTIAVKEPAKGTATIENEFYSVTFDATSGQMTGIVNKVSNTTSPIAQNIYTYCPAPQDSPHVQPSGAYILRTCEPHEPPKPYSTIFEAQHILSSKQGGGVCSEVRQLIQHENKVHQTIRLCEGQDHIELISGIGVVETGTTGVEVVMKLATPDVASKGKWYMDSQGLEVQKRVLNSRPNYPYTMTEPVASNYFPANAFSFINDTNGRNLAVLADRSRGTASLHDGELEFLVLRRLIYDDHRGVNQALNETIRLLSGNRIYMQEHDIITKIRQGSLKQTHKPLVRYGPPSSGPTHWANYLTLDTELPANVHLHTRTMLSETTMMVRLQHLFAVDEGHLAMPVTVDLKSVLPNGLRLVSMEEYDMNGIQPLSAVNTYRQQFKVCDATTGVNRMGPAPFAASTSASSTLVTLHPMDIRTFMLVFDF